MGLRTPWGPAQETRELADGVVLVSTASHGGILLSAKRRAAMPTPLRKVETYAGGSWYEEDEDVRLVILAYPELFTARQVQLALDTGCFRDEIRAALAAWTGPARERCEALAREERDDAR